jgi:hypothetical protein
MALRTTGATSWAAFLPGTQKPTGHSFFLELQSLCEPPSLSPLSGALLHQAESVQQRDRNAAEGEQQVQMHARFTGINHADNLLC